MGNDIYDFRVNTYCVNDIYLSLMNMQYEELVFILKFEFPRETTGFVLWAGLSMWTGGLALAGVGGWAYYTILGCSISISNGS